MSNFDKSEFFCYVIQIPILYSYLDETSLALLKMVSKGFYGAIAFIRDEYKINSTNIKLFRLYSGTIELAKLAMSKNTLPKSELFLKIVEHGSLDVVKYCIESKLLKNIPKRRCCEKAASNSLSVLQYFHMNGYTWDEHTCVSAAMSGRLDCLRYAHENGCKLNDSTCELAANCGNIDCLKYARENGCKWDKFTCAGAAENGYLDCLKYAHENGCEWDEFTCAAAAGNGNLECLIYAHDNGCKWSEFTSEVALLNTQLECLRYLCDNECPASNKTRYEARKFGIWFD